MAPWHSVIASDAMSRGLDIEDVENVINYDVPPFIKTYVHRCGCSAELYLIYFNLIY
jgi:ATP-dependent RNA helicase DDX51/DBP6